VSGLWTEERNASCIATLDNQFASSPPMKLPMPRFTLHWLIVAVVVVGFILGFAARADRRREHFHLIALEHERKANEARMEETTGRKSTPPLSPGRLALLREKESFHLHMYGNYRMASRYSWLFIDPNPDPPEPK
jgi:hypothetical protein